MQLTYVHGMHDVVISMRWSYKSWPISKASLYKEISSLYVRIFVLTYSGNVWRITELKVIGEIKFGEWIDFGHKVLLPAKIWLVKVWRITDDLPNFPAAKHSHYTVINIRIIIHLYATVIIIYLYMLITYNIPKLYTSTYLH